MKRHLYGLMAMAGVTVIVVIAVVTGAIAQTMGEYGAATASAGTAASSTGPLDSQAPETVWSGATQFPDDDQFSGKSSFPDTDRFSSSDSDGSSDRFSSADKFSDTNALDSSQDRFNTGDRWSQDSWGK